MNAALVQNLLQAARGQRPVDLLLCNVRLVNVFSGAVVATDLAIAGGRVVGFGPYPAVTTVDLGGSYVAPGFIDAHVHIESAMLSPSEFARAVLPRGTTAVIADPHEIANVAGIKGIDYMLTAGARAPLNYYFSLPSCVPASPLETAGAKLSTEALRPYLNHPLIVGLAEMMNFPGVLHADPDVLAKIAAMHHAGKPVDGHAPGLSGRDLNAYLIPGIGSDHECSTAQEAREKLAAGLHIMVREGTGARNLDALLPVIDARTARRMMWCTDDRHAHDLMVEGHIDALVRRAVRGGLDPIIAIQMATLNPAEYFGLRHVGAVAPGRRADLVVMDDLGDPVVRQVYRGGRLVAEQGRLLPSAGLDTASGDAKAEKPRGAVRLTLERLDLRVPARAKRMRVIEALPDQIVTRSASAEPLVVDGQVIADPGRDLLKIAVIERHHGTGRTGLGFIRGFGLKTGAIASTVAHDSHHLIVVGAGDADICAAVAALADMGGGLVVVEQTRVVARLALPVGGLMSDQPLAQVCRAMDDLLAAARRLGSNLRDPFMTLSFMALPVIPALKITDHGLVDVAAFKIVPLFLDE